MIRKDIVLSIYREKAIIIESLDSKLLNLIPTFDSIKNKYNLQYSELELIKLVNKINKKIFNLRFHNFIEIRIHRHKILLAEKIKELYEKRGFKVDIKRNVISNSFLYFIFISKYQILIKISKKVNLLNE